jgi:hypothetical protein
VLEALERCQGAQQRALARPVRPEDGQRLARDQLEAADAELEAAGRRPVCCTTVRTAAIVRVRPTRTAAPASASSKSPICVVMWIEVVSTRVSPSRLPPTMETAPTSDRMPPSAAITAASSPRRISRTSSQSSRSLEMPSARSCVHHSVPRAPTAARLIPTTSGSAISV